MDGRAPDEFSAKPPPRRVARAGVAHRHRDHAGERALAGASSLRNYNDSYTAFVSAMKVALPLLALVLVGLVLMLPQLESAEEKIRASVTQQIKAHDLENLYMVNARYVGTDDKNRAYTLTANSARQVSTESDLVALEGPKADVSLGDGHWVAMQANAGAFYRKAQSLVLFGDVNIFHDDGYTVRTGEVEMNLKKGTATGSKPVVAHGPLGLLRASGFKILEKGETVLFTGKARLTIYLDEGKTGQLGAIRGLGDGDANGGGGQTATSKGGK
ncbi:MAG TPA: LPS export ABC transporter periplasmic protein LptC [Alphaproteobacteria bacterium]|nr:LPS export ABC transporter periplasmic protein LptC [Alphaproteobacteria bacterium]